jgi:hypothetical protein
VLLDAAAGYGFANRVINDPDLYFETDAYGHTEHRGQTTTIWIDHEHSPNVTRTRLWEGLRASLRGENTRGVFENWRKRYWVKWWSNRCWKYIATGGFH